MNKNTELNFYLDTLIVQEVLLNDNLIKKTGILSTIKDSITSYFDSHNDPNDQVGTLLNFLAPGAISVLIGGWLGPTFGLAMRVLNIDVAGILRSLYDGIKELIGGNQHITSSQVDNLVFTTVQQNTGENLQTSSFNQQLKDAKFLKLAVINLHQNNFSVDEMKKVFAADRKVRTIGILAKLLSWIFKVAISSAGLMVAGDAVNKMIGKPNAFDKTIEHGKPVDMPVSKPSAPISTQTKFPVKSNYSDVQHNSGSWIENYPNTQSGIENMLVSFTKEVYSGLDNLDSIIKSSPKFQTTVSEILWFNHAAAGDPVVFLPKFFTSKKQLVDHFIDDISSRVS